MVTVHSAEPLFAWGGVYRDMGGGAHFNMLKDKKIERTDPPAAWLSSLNKLIEISVEVAKKEKNSRVFSLSNVKREVVTSCARDPFPRSEEA